MRTAGSIDVCKTTSVHHTKLDAEPTKNRQCQLMRVQLLRFRKDCMQVSSNLCNQHPRFGRPPCTPKLLPCASDLDDNLSELELAATTSPPIANGQPPRSTVRIDRFIHPAPPIVSAPCLVPSTARRATASRSAQSLARLLGITQPTEALLSLQTVGAVL